MNLHADYTCHPQVSTQLWFKRMNGLTDLDMMLSTMVPNLSETDYVFHTVPNGSYGEFQNLLPIASFQEAEGLTLVVARHVAQSQGIDCSSVFSCISLSVHSSLEAVGLTAAVANTLADCGISANVIAAFYHDHIFVPKARASEALQALQALSSRSESDR